MLSSLQIENVAVIQKANVHFEKGLNVLTGETGAGKSILIVTITVRQFLCPIDTMSGRPRILTFYFRLRSICCFLFLLFLFCLIYVSLTAC